MRIYRINQHSVSQVDYSIRGINHRETTKNCRDTSAVNYYHNHLCNNNQSDANTVIMRIMNRL